MLLCLSGQVIDTIRCRETLEYLNGPVLRLAREPTAHPNMFIEAVPYMADGYLRASQSSSFIHSRVEYISSLN